MTLLDRYIIRLFLFNFLILYVVISGLVVLLDLITNFDEFAQIAQTIEGDWAEVGAAVAGAVVDCYGPMLLLFYNYLVGLLPVGAAAFTLAMLIRNRELIAMLAGGISMKRVAAPMIALGVGASALMLVNQELLIPSVAHKLLRSRAEIKHGQVRARPVFFMPDSTGALFTAARYQVESETLHDLTILVRDPVQGGGHGRTIQRITAAEARWDARAKAWRFTDGVAVERQSGLGAGGAEFAAGQPHQIAIFHTDLDPTTILMRQREKVRNLLSIAQLQEMIDHAQPADLPDLLRAWHSRFSLLAINILILLMGIPYFLIRSGANLLAQTAKAAPLVVGAWGGGFVLLQASPDFLPPAAVAWLPVAMYLPIAYYLMDTVES
jgi:lipopolysaccharide export system permease protein